MKFSKLLLAGLACLVLNSVQQVKAQSYFLPLDADGWTILPTPTQSIYVSAAGNDTTGNGTISSPYATFAKGEGLLIAGGALYLRNGDTFTGTGVNSIVSGSSSSAPTIITGYSDPNHPSTVRPIIDTTNGEMLNIYNGTVSNVAIVGLQVVNVTRSSTATTYYGIRLVVATTNLLIEDCNFDGNLDNIAVGASATATSSNIIIRRCEILDAYENAVLGHSTNTGPQGIWNDFTNGLLVEDNIFDHNGWDYTNHYSDDYGRDEYNHDLYCDIPTVNIVFRNNITAEDLDSVQMRSGGTADNNFFLQDCEGILMDHANGSITNNVGLQFVGDYVDPTYCFRGIGFNVDEWGTYQPNYVPGSTITVTGNLLSDPTGTITMGYSVYNGSSISIADKSEPVGTPIYGSVESNIAYNWGTVTLSAGDGMTISGNAIQNPQTSPSTLPYLVTVPWLYVNSSGTQLTLAQSYSFSDNTYCEPSTITTPFTVSLNGTSFTNYSFANWQSYGGTGFDSGSTYSTTPVSYPTPTANVEAYMTSLGLSPTLPAFLSAIRGQSKATWNFQFTAPEINNFFRTSFSMPIVNSGDWLSTDIGSVGYAGSTTISGSTFTVEGSGAEIWGTADACQYGYQTMSGDGQIIVEVDSAPVVVSGGGSVNSHAQAGIMIRESTAAGSKNVCLALFPSSGGMNFQARSSTGGTTAEVLFTGSIGAPKYLKLVRSGNTFTGSYSSDGVTWTTPTGNSTTITMNTNLIVGLTVTASNNAQLDSATFNNVSVTP